MSDRTITIRELVVGFMQASLMAVGGAAAPLRHMVVRRRKWLTEEEFAETFGMCQVLPGAVGASVSVLIGDRFAGWRGGVLSVLAFSLPAMILAVTLAALALHLAALNPRVASAELGITSAASGLFLANGLRAVRVICSAQPATSAVVRNLRLALVAFGVVLVVGLHLSLPVVVAIMMAAGIFIEWRLQTRPAPAHG